LILGLGGGSGDDEHRAFGLGVRSAKEKTDGLEEAVRIIRGLWSEERLTFAGRLYRTEDAPLEPKPERKIPIWLGTFAPRALAVTGRLADGWIPSLGYAPPDEVVVMRERVLRAAEEAGRDPTQITCAYNVAVRVGEAAGGDADAVSGPPEAIVARLREFADLGFSAFNFMVDDDAGEQAERLAQGRPADPELGGQILLAAEEIVRPEPLLLDVVLDLYGHLFAGGLDRAPRRGPRPLPTVGPHAHDRLEAARITAGSATLRP
jgi:alkanesulfonate monooxygenase SsuD/methylene tetrahydromethanopterin reductase-like flavin-dependent oxidoreductase (luciferase family)